MLVVKKFGGSSVADRDCMFRVAERCIEEYRKGNDVIVVLSAMGNTTDELLKKAGLMNQEPDRREMDMLLTTGEQISVSLLAMAIHSMGVPAISLNAFQVRMHCTSTYGNARLESVEAARLFRELEAGRIVIVTGFQGVNKYEDYATLGRGGSDTTAVAIAAALKADICEIYTDVEGVYTADPRMVPNAQKLDVIGYDEMLELSSLGVKVLHNRSVETAKKYGVQLVVRSSMSRAEGTMVKDVTKMENMSVSGVACDKNTVRVSVTGVADRPDVVPQILQALAKKEVNVDMVLQLMRCNGTRDIFFTMAEEGLRVALTVLEENRKALTTQDISYNSNVAKISVVGIGMMRNSEASTKMFEALSHAGVKIHMIFASEVRITALVREGDAERALAAVHDSFDLSHISQKHQNNCGYCSHSKS